MNHAKTVTNFTVGEDGAVQLDEESEPLDRFVCSVNHVFTVEEWMPWCGMLINTRNLQVRSDFSRYTRKSESHSLVFLYSDSNHTSILIPLFLSVYTSILSYFIPLLS